MVLRLRVVFGQVVVEVCIMIAILICKTSIVFGSGMALHFDQVAGDVALRALLSVLVISEAAVVEASGVIVSITEAVRVRYYPWR